MKVRNRYRFGRLWLSAAALALGVLAGAFVGRESILHSVHSRMQEYTDRVLKHDEELSAEILSTLAQANSSPYPPCSDPDLALLRRLTFESRYIKDVARLGADDFLCSAVSGPIPKPLPMAVKPDYVMASGIRIYRNFPLSLQGGLRGDVIARGNADLVLSPDIYSDFPQEPIHYSLAFPDSSSMVGASTGKPAPVMTDTGQMTSIPSQILTAQATVSFEGSLYRASCSQRFGVCALTSISLRQVWRIHRSLLYVYMATGALAGASCALALMVAGRRRRSQTNQLKRAILKGKLSVVYQPIVELGSHHIVGAEALARWTDEDGDSIRPETIVALAEAEGFVSEITRFVLTRVLDELGEILESNRHFGININLASSDLADPRLLLLLDEKLHGGRITPANLTFELTERATADREVAVASIRRLRERGHAVFIDDFGTGYSNLAYLTELNADGVKINRSFIATIGTESVTASIVPQILAVAKALSLKVVVQGIEREEQAHYFASGDPRMLGQGWFFGLPVPAKGLMYLCAEKTE